MLALNLFAVVEEDVDKSAAVAVEDMEVLTTLDKVAVAVEASAAVALRAACSFPCFLSIDFPSRKEEWRFFICKISCSLRKELGLFDLFFNTLYLLESVKISCLHQPDSAMSHHFFLQLLDQFLLWTRHGVMV